MASIHLRRVSTRFPIDPSRQHNTDLRYLRPETEKKAEKNPVKPAGF